MKRLSLHEDVRPLSEFRSHAASFVETVRDKGRPLLITHRGKSAAVLMGVAQYDELLDQLELLQDVQAAERQLEAGLGVPHEKAREQLLDPLKQ